MEILKSQPQACLCKHQPIKAAHISFLLLQLYFNLVNLSKLHLVDGCIVLEADWQINIGPNVIQFFNDLAATWFFNYSGLKHCRHF